MHSVTPPSAHPDTPPHHNTSQSTTQPNFAHTNPTSPTTHTIPNLPTWSHPMVTRAQVGTVKPNSRFHGHASHISHISPILKSPIVAISYPNWRDAMYDEYNALIKNSTWVLVSKPPNVNVVQSMWLFRHKYHVDGSLSMYKARLVANGRSQQFGVDCDDTFSHVKLATIRTVLSLACLGIGLFISLMLRIHFLTTTFLRLCYASRVSFSPSRCDSSLFIYQHGSEVAYLLIYVDDIVLTASSTNLLQRIISSLHKEFDMTDLGALNYFLGIFVTHDSTGLFLSPKKYALELLDRGHMANCNPTRTPVDTKSKLGSDGDPISDPTLYRSLACGLHYLTFTRPDISYAVQQHQRTKHIEIDIHFVRDMVAHGQVRFLHVPSRYQYADIFTKGLPSVLFEEFRTSLSVRPSPAQTARAY
ncbi:ribonuclease H-like domain-containing protein [Tanacetum coccineum]